MFRNILISTLNQFNIKYPTPRNIQDNENLLILGLVSLIIKSTLGIFLIIVYTPHIDYAFVSIEHIMRDVSLQWLFCNSHANGASIFFIAIYILIIRGLCWFYNTKIMRTVMVNRIKERFIFFLITKQQYIQASFLIVFGTVVFISSLSTILTQIFNDIPLEVLPSKNVLVTEAEVTKPVITEKITTKAEGFKKFLLNKKLPSIQPMTYLPDKMVAFSDEYYRYYLLTKIKNEVGVQEFNNLLKQGMMHDLYKKSITKIIIQSWQITPVDIRCYNVHHLIEMGLFEADRRFPSWGIYSERGLNQNTDASNVMLHYTKQTSIDAFLKAHPENQKWANKILNNIMYQHPTILSDQRKFERIFGPYFNEIIRTLKERHPIFFKDAFLNGLVSRDRNRFVLPWFIPTPTKPTPPPQPFARYV